LKDTATIRHSTRSPHAIVCRLRVPHSALIVRRYSVTGRLRYGKLFNVTRQTDSFGDLHLLHCRRKEWQSDAQQLQQLQTPRPHPSNRLHCHGRSITEMH